MLMESATSTWNTDFSSSFKFKLLTTLELCGTPTCLLRYLHSGSVCLYSQRPTNTELRWNTVEKKLIDWSQLLENEKLFQLFLEIPTIVFHQNQFQKPRNFQKPLSNVWRSSLTKNFIRGKEFPRFLSLGNTQVVEIMSITFYKNYLM